MTRKAIWAGAVRRPAVTIAAGGIMIAALAPAGAQTVDKGKHMIEGVRDARYCEIIPVVRKGFRLVGTVYNTLGLNDCPPAVWDKITEDAMRKRFRALMVVLNGKPFRDGCHRGRRRYRFGRNRRRRLALTARATIKLRLADVRTKPYRERTVDRQTRYVFMAGRSSSWCGRTAPATPCSPTRRWPKSRCPMPTCRRSAAGSSCPPAGVTKP